MPTVMCTPYYDTSVANVETSRTLTITGLFRSQVIETLTFIKLCIVHFQCDVQFNLVHILSQHHLNTQ